MQKLPVAVVGVGYLGRIHARKFAQLSETNLVAVVDSDGARARAVGAELGVPAYSALRDLPAGVGAAAIAVPTECHHAVASACIERGMHVLVEKPITQNAAQADDLINRARARNVVLQVGHLERFNPAVTALRRVIERPLFIESHRLAAFKPRSIDISVVLDLMIHDIDIILSLVPGEVGEIRASGFPVLTDAVDIANARIEFTSGCVANITASRVSQKAMRRLRAFEHNAYVAVDYGENVLQIARKLGNQTDAAGFPLIAAEEQRFEAADPLLAEVESFVRAVREGGAPAVTGMDGKRALEVALQITRSIEQGARP